MGCLASVAKYQKNIACSPDQTVWDIVGAVLKRQVQMVSTAVRSRPLGSHFDRGLKEPSKSRVNGATEIAA
jgi:hypothetical protein